MFDRIYSDEILRLNGFLINYIKKFISINRKKLHQSNISGDMSTDDIVLGHDGSIVESDVFFLLF